MNPRHRRTLCRKFSVLIYFFHFYLSENFSQQTSANLQLPVFPLICSLNSHIQNFKLTPTFTFLSATSQSVNLSQSLWQNSSLRSAFFSVFTPRSPSALSPLDNFNCGATSRSTFGGKAPVFNRRNNHI